MFVVPICCHNFQQQHPIFCQVSSRDVEVVVAFNFNVSTIDLAEYGVLLLTFFG